MSTTTWANHFNGTVHAVTIIYCSRNDFSNKNDLSFVTDDNCISNPSDEALFKNKDFYCSGKQNTMETASWIEMSF